MIKLILGGLQIAFVVMKLMVVDPVAAWSWWLVMSPLMAMIVFQIIALILVFGGIAAAAFAAMKME